MTETINANSHIGDESSTKCVIFLWTHCPLKGPNRSLGNIKFVFHLLVFSSYLKPGE